MEPEALQSASNGLDAGDAAVLWTGHDLHLSSPDYFYNRPHLTRRRSGMVGEPRSGSSWRPTFRASAAPATIASWQSASSTGEGRSRSSNSATSSRLEGRSWHLFAAPLRIRGAAGSLLRAVGLIDWRPREVVDLTLDTFREMSALGGAVPTTWTRADHDLTGFFYNGELSYQTTSMFLSEHAGTHLDAPYHFDEQGAAIHELPVEGLLVQARVFDFSHKKPREGIATGRSRGSGPGRCRAP